MKITALIINIFFDIILFPTLGMAIMSPMMFDAPGSEKDQLLKAIFWLVILLPISIIVSQFFAWSKYSGGNYLLSIKISLIPIIDFIAIIIILLIKK